MPNGSPASSQPGGVVEATTADGLTEDEAAASLKLVAFDLLALLPSLL